MPQLVDKLVKLVDKSVIFHYNFTTTLQRYVLNILDCRDNTIHASLQSLSR